MHSPFLKLLCCLSCILAAVGSIHLGLSALGYNVFAMANLTNLYEPFAYIVGVAGVVSIVLYVLKLSCCAGSCKDSCDTYERR